MTSFDPDRPCVLIHARGRMIPVEAAFWTALRNGLRERGCELLLIAHHRAQEPMDVPLLCVRNGLDAVRPLGFRQGWRRWLPTDGSLDETFLLDRDRQWNGSELDVSHRERRRLALYFFRDFYYHALEIAQPRLTVIWNGEHPQEIILRDLARQRGCPVWYIERAPFPGVLHVDPEGILGGSIAARKQEWSWPDRIDRAHWLQVVDRLLAKLRRQEKTWWDQPKSHGPAALRARLGVPDNKAIVFFPGQVDADVQNLLYSPHFDGTLDAFRWFVERMRERNDVFVLGKHHPKSSDPVSAFRSGLGDKGVWLDDISLQDCLAVASHVAAVNSTVLFEALTHERPVLALGMSLLSQKKIAYEITDRGANTAVFERWLLADDHVERQHRWRDFAANFLATFGYAMDSDLASVTGIRDASALAETLAEAAQSPSAKSQPRRTTIPAPLEEVFLWDHNAGSENPDPPAPDAPRLVCLTDKRFWDEAYGSRRRIAQLLRFLARSWDVVAFFTGEIDDQDGARAIQRFPWLRLYSARAMFSAERQQAGRFSLEEVLMAERPAVLLAEFFRVTPLIKECAPCARRGILHVLDTHDVMHERTKAFAEFGMRSERPTTSDEEAFWLDHFDRVLAIQPQEAVALRELTNKPILTVPHGQEVEPAPRVLARGPSRIGIFASLGEPQFYGVQWFLENVWTTLHQRIASSELHVFGRVCERLDVEQMPRGVVLRGFVADLRQAYASVDLAVNPAQFGSGLSIKSVEALCFGKPLACSPVGAAGLPDAGSPVVVCKTPGDWLSALEKLTRDRASRRQVEGQTSSYAERYFSPEAAYGKFERELRAAAANSMLQTGAVDLRIRVNALLTFFPPDQWPAYPCRPAPTERVFVLGVGPRAALVRACLPANIAVVAHLAPSASQGNLQFLDRPILPPESWPPPELGARIIDGREPGAPAAAAENVALTPPDEWLRDVAIFGTGAAAHQAVSTLGGTARVIAFADNDANKQGTTFLGRPVVSPQQLRSSNASRIVIASMHHVAIGRQLSALGFNMTQIGVFDVTQLSASENLDFGQAARERAACFFDWTKQTFAPLAAAFLLAPHVSILSSDARTIAAGIAARALGTTVTIHTAEAWATPLGKLGIEIDPHPWKNSPQNTLVIAPFSYVGSQSHSVVARIDEIGRVSWESSRRRSRPTDHTPL